MREGIDEGESACRNCGINGKEYEQAKGVQRLGKQCLELELEHSWKAVGAGKNGGS